MTNTAPERHADEDKRIASASDAGSVTVAALESAWRDVQARHPEVPDVVVISGGGLDMKRQEVKWGHFVPGQWDTDSGLRHELLVSGECLSQGPRHTLETVLHEAAHALNFARDVKDTSRRGAYHNKRFVSAAKELGLEWPDETQPDGTRGFSGVKLTEDTATEYAETLERLERGRWAWRDLVVPGSSSATDGADGESGDEDGEGKPKRKRSKNTKPKAVCQCGPDRAIWASRRVLESLTVQCGECNSPYEPEEPDED